MAFPRLPSTSLASLFPQHLRPVRAIPLPFTAQRVPLLHRSYATDPQSPAEIAKAKQQLQIKMTDKAARMKRNMGMMGAIPAFANYIRPAERSKRSPPGSSLKTRRKYWIADTRAWGYDWWLRYGLRKSLGKEWHPHFMQRATEAYRETNESIATGNYEKLAPLATHSLIDSIKSKRSSSFQGLKLSWKMHKLVAQEIACVRQQELMKKGEFIAQIAVRFVTDQSLEIRNSRGELVGSGRHDAPVRVTEYYVFQREVWKRREDWKIMKQMKEIDPFNPGQEEVQLV